VILCSIDAMVIMELMIRELVSVVVVVEEEEMDE